MAEPALVARGPIRLPGPTRIVAGWEVAGGEVDWGVAGVRLTDETPSAKVLVSATPAATLSVACGVGFGSARRTGDVLVVGSGPGTWLLLGPAGHAADLLSLAGGWAGQAGDALVSIIDVTSGRAVLRLTGMAAVEVLARMCGLDLDRAPDGCALRSSVARVTCDIVRDDVAGERSHLLVSDRSVGGYLWDAVLDAGRDLGVARRQL